MNLPSLNEARRRSKEETLTKTNDYIITNELQELGLGKTYHVKTYGCQMNEHDSENMRAIIEDMGFTPNENIDEADLVVLNTCSIRENAHNKAFGQLGRLKHTKEERPDLMVGLAGCMSQEEKVVEEVLKKHKHVNFVIGTHNIHNLPKVLYSSLQKQITEVEVFSIEGDIYENIPVKRESDYKAWVNIMLGCDKFCTYCIVPYTRGKQRSRSKDFIVKEVEDLVASGYQEVTLLGQNVNAYGKDLSEDYRMHNLLEDVAKTGINRIRFVTSHPWDFSDEMIDVIKNNSNIMSYIHLPFQSGSNSVLKLMGRKYTQEEYITLYKKIKEALPYSSITTDIIVGFPNETESDFEKTLEVVNTCKFDSAFTFLFSPRKGTPAANMIDNVSLDEKNSRLQKLNKLINKYQREANESYLNKTIPVLIEGVSKKHKDLLYGYSDTMKLVNVKADNSNIGKIINVKITNIKTWSMDGEKQ